MGMGASWVTSLATQRISSGKIVDQGDSIKLLLNVLAESPLVAAFSMTAVSQNEKLRILDKDMDLGVVLYMGLDRALKRFQKCQSML